MSAPKPTGVGCERCERKARVIRRLRGALAAAERAMSGHLASLSEDEIRDSFREMDRARERAVNALSVARQEPPDALADFIDRWAGIVQGGDKLESLEGWAREFVTEARAALQAARGAR